jgi:DNA-binding Xre family transcriptional regulator
MLLFNSARVFKARGIDRPANYLKNQGYSIATTTRIVNNQKQGFSLGTLEKLCLTLNCTPNDFLEWVPSKDMVTNSNHALNVLKRSDTLASVTQLVNNASLEKLEKIQEIIQRELEG